MDIQLLYTDSYVPVVYTYMWTYVCTISTCTRVWTSIYVLYTMYAGGGPLIVFHFGRHSYRYNWMRLYTIVSKERLLLYEDSACQRRPPRQSPLLLPPLPLSLPSSPPISPPPPPPPCSLIHLTVFLSFLNSFSACYLLFSLRLFS